MVKRRTTGLYDPGGCKSSFGGSGLRSRCAADATSSLFVSILPVMSSVCGMTRGTTLRCRPGSSLSLPPPWPPAIPPIPPMGIPIGTPPMPADTEGGVPVAPTGRTAGVGGAPVVGATAKDGAPPPPAGVVGASPPAPLPPMSPRSLAAGSPSIPLVPVSKESILDCASPDKPCVAAPIAWVPACMSVSGTLAAAPRRPPTRPPAAPSTVGMSCGNIDAISPELSAVTGSALVSGWAFGSPAVVGSNESPVPAPPGSSPAVAVSVFSW